MSATSAWYSITGMTAIFPAAIIPVIIMGIVLEFGKITSVIFLHRNWNKAPFTIKSYLVVAVFILMFINSLGIFGLLSKAHIQQEVLNNSQFSQTEIIQSKIDNENSVIKDINNQMGQIDSALTKLTEQGKALTSINQGNSQRKIRDSLVTQKNQHLATMQELTKEKIEADNNNAKVASDFGPLLYIADAFYGQASKVQLETTVRWIIIIIVMVFDPLALVLLIASQFSFDGSKKSLTKPDDKDIFDFEKEVLKL